ncbi:MAG: hypothetical protein ABI385_01695 [Lapillicoccus sp.]
MSGYEKTPDQEPPATTGGQPPPWGTAAPMGQQAPVAEDPGKTLGIVGLILSFFTALIGMIVSIIAWRKSKGAGLSNVPAVIGIVVGALGTVVLVIAIIVGVVAFNTLMTKCNELGPGVHRDGGVTYTCS